MADWTGLPSDILGLLAERLELLENYHRFRAVCKSWRSLTPPEKKPNFSPRFPPGGAMLITNDREDKKALLFHSLSTTSSSEVLHRIDLPEAAGRRHLVAYPGWILTIGFDFKINLLHPFTREQVSMPSMLTFRDQYEYDEELTPESVVHMFVRKAVASTDPTHEDDCVVLAIYGDFRIPAFAKPGDSEWTDIDTMGHICFDDAVYFEGKFYIIDCRGAVFTCDLNNGRVATKIVPPAAAAAYDWDQYYIVESEGDPFLVRRIRAGKYFREAVPEPRVFGVGNDRRVYLTVGFQVFKVETTTTHDDDDISDAECNYSLTEVFDLGDRALFVGYNPSVSMSSSSSSSGDCVSGNNIYFSEDNAEFYGELRDGGGHDTGIFDMDSDSVVEWIYDACTFKHPLSPPMWYLV